MSDVGIGACAIAGDATTGRMEAGDGSGASAKSAKSGKEVYPSASVRLAQFYSSGIITCVICRGDRRLNGLRTSKEAIEQSSHEILR